MAKDAQNASLLDALKKKMRQAREDAEGARDEADEAKRKLQEEKKKREEVGFFRCLNDVHREETFQIFWEWVFSKHFEKFDLQVFTGADS